MNKVTLTLVCPTGMSLKRLRELGVILNKRIKGVVVEMTDQKLLSPGELLVADYGLVLTPALRAQDKANCGTLSIRGKSSRRQGATSP